MDGFIQVVAFIGVGAVLGLIMVALFGMVKMSYNIKHIRECVDAPDDDDAN